MLAQQRVNKRSERRAKAQPKAGRRALIEARGVDLFTPSGRPLFRDLNITLGLERVALVGRNGAGKSTLLRLLAGLREPARGQLRRRGRARLVPQQLASESSIELARDLSTRLSEQPDFARAWTREAAELGAPRLPDILAAGGLSPGEARKLHLLAAALAEPELLLLDEPSEELDARGLAWLRRRLETWPNGLVVISHDRALLERFSHFVVIAEGGCRYIPGSLQALRVTLEQQARARREQYARNLSALEQQEQHHDTVCRRRRRKKNVGRLHELGRCTPRSRLNSKRGYAQESQARVAKIRAQRIGAARAWAKATRRALEVTLPLELMTPALPEPDPRDAAPIITLDRVDVSVGARPLLTGLSAGFGRERVAVTGPNGAGKTTLLRVMLGQHEPTSGAADRQRARIGVIAQGAGNWMLEDSLVSLLMQKGSSGSGAGLDSLEDAARQLLAHRFPLALAERPLASLSPGERVRAALICLFRRRPALSLLVLDEPTYSLDRVGVEALREVLRAWPGGLIVSSHDHDFLDAIRVDTRIVLDGAGGHTIERA